MIKQHRSLFTLPVFASVNPSRYWEPHRMDSACPKHEHITRTRSLGTRQALKERAKLRSDRQATNNAHTDHANL
jgi:hypothetical protein